MTINDPSLLIIGTNLSVDVGTRRIGLFAGGVLTSTGQVTWAALRARLALLWLGAPYSAHPFPVMRRSDTDYAIGTDGHTFNGWTFEDQPTRDFMAGGAWTEYSAAGVIEVEYARATSGPVPAEAFWYYQVPGFSNVLLIARTGILDSGIMVYLRDVLDYRTEVITLRCRTRGYNYASSSFMWTDTADFRAAIEPDGMIIDSDGVIDTAERYAGIEISDLTSAAYRDVVTPSGLQSKPFSLLIDAAGATLSHVYQWVQRALRKNTVPNSAPGGDPYWRGYLSDELVTFATDGLVQFARGVFVDNLRAADWARVRFKSDDAVSCALPWAPGSADTAEMHSLLVDVSRLHGLDPDAPLVVSPTQRSAGDIVQTITDVAGTVTVTRAP